MTHQDFRDWIPCQLAWDGDTPLIEWAYFPETRYQEPFFGQTIDGCLKRPFNLLFRRKTNLYALLAWAAKSPGITPTGFIFHVSRCGSTLVSNLLGNLPSALKISEASPLDSVIRIKERFPGISEAEHLALLRALVGALDQRRTEDQTRLFIKFDAWNTHHLPLLRAAFPEVPWVFVYRNPVEVLVSGLRTRGAHMIPLAVPPGLFGMTLPEAAQLSPEQYGARVLASTYAAGLQNHLPGKSVLVNHSQLPQAVWTTIAPAFGLDLTSEERAHMEQESQTHAKSRFIFESDSEQKRREASDAIREAARQWIDPVYERLEAARKLQTVP